MIYAHLRKRNEIEKNRVGLLLHPEIASYIPDINNYSNIIIALTIIRGQRTETNIQAYAKCSNNYGDDEKDKFYDDFSEEDELSEENQQQ